MRDYGKVHTSFWSSSTIGSMSEDARTLALYLLTSPHTTIAGVMRLPDGYVCEDLRWGSERVSKGFAELFAKGFANRCETTKWVWICKHFHWNQPENPNQRKAAAKVALSIPDECRWKPDYIRVCGEILGIEPEPLLNGSETVSKPFRNQKQEQEQKQEQKTADAPQASPAAPEAPPRQTASPPSPAVVGPESAPKLTEPAGAARGTRLPADWKLTRQLADEAARARAAAGLPPLTVDELRAEGAKFADYWHAKAGKDATKVDWPATWRNWIRNVRTAAGAPIARPAAAPTEPRIRMEDIPV